MGQSFEDERWNMLQTKERGTLPLIIGSGFVKSLPGCLQASGLGIAGGITRSAEKQV